MSLHSVYINDAIHVIQPKFLLYSCSIISIHLYFIHNVAVLPLVKDMGLQKLLLELLSRSGTTLLLDVLDLLFLVATSR